MAKTTDEDRLKKLSAKIEKRKQMAAAKKAIDDAKAAYKKLRGK
jgi:hypothetical protein